MTEEIAGRGQAEALKASEIRYRRLFEAAKDGILILDADTGKIVDVNPFLTELTGYSRADFLGTPLWEIGPFKDIAASKASFAELQAKEYVRYDDLPLQARDGRTIAVEFVSNVYRADHQNVIQCNIRDITERKRTETALRNSELNFAAVFRSSPVAMGMASATDGTYHDVNDAFLNDSGFTRAEVIGHTSLELNIFASPEDRDRLIEQVIHDGSVYGLPIVLRTKSGALRHCLISMCKLTAGNESLFLSAAIDINDLKLAEAQRERLTAAIEQIAEVVMVTDTQGAIEYANPAFETVTGYTRAEALGRNPRFLKSGLQDEAFYSALWETVSAGKAWHGRMVNKRKNGTLFTEDATISPIRDADGVITSYVAVKRDITRELNLETQLLQSQKMDSIGRLAGGVAHDFNNLLSVILSYSELLVEPLAKNDPMRGDLEEIVTAANRAAALTRQLLSFSHQQIMQPKTVDAGALLSGMEKMLRRIVGEDVELVVTSIDSLGMVTIDPGQLEQVVMNLVVNARDALPKGGRVTIEATNVALDEVYAQDHLGVSPGPYVMIAISDTGVGMDKATQARIFEPFFTTKEKGKGTGLGLSTVFGIVKQSAGSVWVYSEPGEGTTFKVYLPRTDGVVDDTPAAQPLAILSGSETILLVEDEDQVRAVARDILKRNGYRVIEARNAGEALLLCEREAGTIHLLLTDVVMPNMSGPELARRLAQIRPEMKVLCMSGYTDDTVVRHGILDSSIAFLQKPITPETLSRKVREVLETRS